MTEFVASLGVSQFQLILVLVVFYLVLGCFIETLSMMVGTIPMVFPIILHAGIDPVWFGIFLVLMMELALITPPVGMNLYVVQGIEEHGAVTDLFLGAATVRRCDRNVCRCHHRVSRASYVATQSDVLMRLLIVNPNTSEMTNARLRTTALESLGPKDCLEVMSADSGVPLIQTPAQSAATEPAVLAAVETYAHQFEAIIIGAFSDPAIRARARVGCPVFWYLRIGDAKGGLSG